MAFQFRVVFLSNLSFAHSPLHRSLRGLLYVEEGLFCIRVTFFVLLLLFPTEACRDSDTLHLVPKLRQTNLVPSLSRCLPQFLSPLCRNSRDDADATAGKSLKCLGYVVGKE